MNVDAWEILKSVLATDLQYWKDSEAQAFLTKGDEGAIKVALSVIGTSIGVTEYYIEIMEKIENGEISVSGANEES